MFQVEIFHSLFGVLFSLLQETNRTLSSMNVDERTRMEIYAQPFMGAVDAGVLSIMW